MLSRAQLLRCIGHFLLSENGFLGHLVKQFFSGGFAFRSDPTIRRLPGRPYSHLIAVKTTEGKEPSRGFLGIGRQPLYWVIADHREKGIHFCWAVVQPTSSRFMPIWKRIGFKICPISHGQFLALLGELDEDRCRSEGR